VITIYPKCGHRVFRDVLTSWKDSKFEVFVCGVRVLAAKETDASFKRLEWFEVWIIWKLLLDKTYVGLF
jgi:hypothetical protein